jgi:hypothetical protein
MKLFKLCICIIGVYFIIPTSLFSQDKPGYYQDSDGKLYWNKSLPLYINIASDSVSKGVLIKSKYQSQYSNPLYLDTEGINFIRTRNAVDPDTKVMIPNVEIKFEVYADGLSPISKIVYNNAPTFKNGTARYYGKGLIVELSSIDNGSGIKKLDYKINGNPSKAYMNPLTLNTEGVIKISYNASDKVGNTEDNRVKEFIIDLSSPTTYHNINGITDDNVISTSSKIYLTREDNLSGVSKTYYRFDEGNDRIYNGKQVLFGNLLDGEHTFSYYSEDNVKNKEIEKTISFYVDKSAPMTAADILGDRFIIDGKVYFSGRSKLKLTAVDNKSGVKEIKYSVDGEEFKIYDQPFYLPSVAGTHSIRYYSVDNLSNASNSNSAGYESFKHNVRNVYVDLTGPNLSFKILGKSLTYGDTVYIGENTKIKLSGKDLESGMDLITYSMDGESIELKYTAPFSISNPGYHQLNIYGYDNVKNRNISSLAFFVDSKAPELFPTFSVKPVGVKKGLNVYPASMVLFLSATDDLIGFEKIMYKINDLPERQYTGMITGLQRKSKFSVTVKTYDLLGNMGEEIIEFYTDK